MARVEPPQPRMIHRGIAKLSEAHASGPGAFTLMHLQQALTDSRIDVRSDDALNLGASARVRVLIIAIAVVRRDAPGMARGRGWLITHGRLRARKHVLPREVTLGVGLVKLGQEIESSGSGKSGGKTRQGFVCPSIVLGHDRLTRSPNGCAEVIHHSDHEGTR